MTDEFLSRLTRQMTPKGLPRIEKVGSSLRIRRRTVGSAPYLEDVGLHHALLSDPRLSGLHYPDVEKSRTEMSSWKAFSFSQFSVGRAPKRASELRDVGESGEFLLPFLRKLETESPAELAALQAALSQILDGASRLSVHLDERLGILELRLDVHGVSFTAGALPKGVLRAIALLATVINPWSGSLIAVDEPENGLDPRASGRLGEVLLHLAMQRDKQLIVSTHSPWFCEAVMAHQESFPKEIALLHVQNKKGATVVSQFDGLPLFSLKDLSEALKA